MNERAEPVGRSWGPIMNRWRVESQILFAFTLALVVLAIVGALVYRAMSGFIDTSKAAAASRQALAAFDGIDSSLNQATAHERSYLILGDNGDLAARQAAVTRVNAYLAELDRLLSNDPQQNARLRILRRTVADRLLVFEQPPSGRLRSFSAIRQRLTRGPGRTLMRQIRNQVGQMERAEMARLTQRRAAIDRHLHETLATLALLLLFSAASLSLLYVGIRREIHERLQAEAALKRHAELLRESEQRMHAIVDTAAEAIIVIDGNGIIDRFNAAAERTFGYSATEVIGKNVSVLMPDPYHEQHDSYISNYLHTGKARIIGMGRETEGRRKDGRIFPIELSVSEIRIAGKHLFTGVLRDISRRRQRDQELANTMQELQSSNEELKNFAYIVSHDLKAPLRAIGSLADWLRADYTDRLDSEGKEYLRLLAGRVRRMDQLIEGILEYSRVGRVRETRVSVDLDEMIHEILDLLSPPPHIRVEIEGPLPVLTAEPTRMRQLFQNLISNAIKYMDKPEGLIRISGHAANGELHFSVSDNGPGVEPRHHEKIFQLFQTLAPRDRIEGTGVGLALAKKIVELYGGRIWIESTPGQGSSFFFTLRQASSTRLSNTEGAL